MPQLARSFGRGYEELPKRLEEQGGVGTCQKLLQESKRENISPIHEADFESRARWSILHYADCHVPY